MADYPAFLLFSTNAVCLDRIQKLQVNPITSLIERNKSRSCCMWALQSWLIEDQFQLHWSISSCTVHQFIPTSNNTFIHYQWHIIHLLPTTFHDFPFLILVLVFLLCSVFLVFQSFLYQIGHRDTKYTPAFNIEIFVLTCSWGWVGGETIVIFSMIINHD